MNAQRAMRRSCGIPSGPAGRAAAWLAVLGLVLAASGCHSDMFDQKKYKPLGPSTFFRDGQSSRPLIEGTVVHRDHTDDGVMATGKIGTRVVNGFPFLVTEQVVRRGQERFTIYCAPCHGRTGDGRGMIVQRGFPQPPSFHTDSLRARPVGHFVDVIAHELAHSWTGNLVTNATMDHFWLNEGFTTWAERRILDALTAIPHEQSRAIEMAYFEGFTQQEIADRLGEPLGTVKTRMRRAHRLLRDVLEERTSRFNDGG